MKKALATVKIGVLKEKEASFSSSSSSYSSFRDQSPKIINIMAATTLIKSRET